MKPMRKLSETELKLSEKNLKLSQNQVDFLNREIISIKHNIEHQIMFNADVAMKENQKRLKAIESEIYQYNAVIKTLEVQIKDGVEIKDKEGK